MYATTIPLCCSLYVISMGIANEESSHSGSPLLSLRDREAAAPVRANRKQQELTDDQHPNEPAFSSFEDGVSRERLATSQQGVCLAAYRQ
jgi:hypothetical protein